MGLQILGNLTDDAHWQAEPAGRGTSDILQTCLITLGLCVYSSIHLNVPTYGTGNARRWLYKLGWVLLATLAPEIVVYTAWAQRKDATALLRELQKTVWCGSTGRLWFRRVLSPCCGRSKYGTPRDGKREREETYTLTQAFFICMGGLTLELSEEDRGLWPRDIHRMTLTPELVIWMAKTYPELIPKISVETVQDRSKADALVKTLACVQSIWFCLQFVTRLAQGLPATLLELNAFVHTICAILIYTLWWEKPLDATDPICLRTGQSDRMRKVCAQASLHADFKRYRYRSNGEKGPREDVIFSRDTREEILQMQRPEDLVLIPQPADKLVSQDEYPDLWQLDNFPLLKELQSQHAGHISWYNPFLPCAKLSQGAVLPGTDFTLAVKSCEIDESTLWRLRLASELDQTLPTFLRPPIMTHIADIGSDSLSTFVWAKNRNRGVTNARGRSLLNRYSTLALMLSGVFYGGLHLLVLGSGLRGSTETMLWEIACIIIMMGAPIMCLSIVAVERCTFAKIPGGQMFSFLAIALALWAVTLYFICRAFIILEVFILLPHADPGAFQQPSWSIYFPHIA